MVKLDKNNRGHTMEQINILCMEIDNPTTKTLLHEYEEFYKKNIDVGIAFYGLLELDEYGPSAIYDLPYRETIKTPFPFDKECEWQHLPENEIDELRSKIQLGTIAIGSEGCNMYWILVVNGACAGQVWLTSECGVTPVNDGMSLAVWKELRTNQGVAFLRDALKHWGDEEYEFFYSHAPIAMLDHDEVTFATSTPVCCMCYNLLMNYAKSTQATIVVSDPNGTKVFNPNLTVDHID